MSLHLSSTALALLSYPTLCVAALDAALPQVIPQLLTPAIQLEQAVITLPRTATDSIDSPQPQAAPQAADDSPQLKQD